MATRRLFIVWSHPLFRETVHVLLDDPAVEVVGAASEFETVLASLESLKPDVIIVEETDDDTVIPIEALEILRACSWGPRVIRLSLQDNELWVYYHERRSVGSAEDFLRLVRDA